MACMRSGKWSTYMWRVGPGDAAALPVMDGDFYSFVAAYDVHEDVSFRVWVLFGLCRTCLEGPLERDSPAAIVASPEKGLLGKNQACVASLMQGISVVVYRVSIVCGQQAIGTGAAHFL